MNGSSNNFRKGIGSRVVAGFFLLTCLTLIAIGFFLKRGIHLDTVEIGETVVSGISLQWQDKLDIQINTIVLAADQSQESHFDFNIVDQGIRASIWGRKLFSRIIVQTITIGDITASIHLDKESSHFTLSSQNLYVLAEMEIDGDTFLIHIRRAVSKTYNSHISGKIRINRKQKEVTGSLSATLAGVLPISLDFSADPQQISFHGQEDGIITEIKPFVDLFGLEPSVQCWITDYLTGSHYTLKTFSGSFPWDNPQILMDTFYGEIRVDDSQYTFAPGLEPIKAEYTELRFNKGILAITPHNSTFYGQDGGNSWLDINFNDPSNFLLTAYIRTQAVANKDILNLLKYYDIDLPFKQTKGTTKTDLTLVINLDNEQVTSVGTFLIDDGVVEYNQEKYTIHDARITLVDATITLDKVGISFDSMFNAEISGVFDAEKETGDIDLLLQNFAVKIKESNVTLDTSQPQPTLHYQIRPDKSTIHASASSWKFDTYPLQLGAFTAPFSSQDLSGILPPTLLSSPPGITTKISGSFSLNKQQIDLLCDLLKYNVNGLVLEKSPAPIHIHFDKKLAIQSTGLSQWSLNQVPFTLYPSEVTYVDDIFSVVQSRIRYGDSFDSNISGTFDSFSRQGRFTLKKTSITHDTFGVLFHSEDTVSVEINDSKDDVLVTVPQFNIKFRSRHDGWSLDFPNLASIFDNSPFMQHYMLTAGKVGISSTDAGKTYQFSADIPYRYHFLVHNSVPMERYHIDGIVNNEDISATINDNLNLHYRNNLLITSQDFAYNIPAIIQFLKDRPKTVTINDTTATLRCMLTAQNSALILGPDRQALADQITLEYTDDTVRIQLMHGDGTLVMDIDGEEFSLTAANFNDVFMAALLPGSEFHTGAMSMAAKGNFDEFSALVKIEDTIIRDFATLNNILALVNTIPALITFSLPSYSTKGLPVDSMLAGMTIKNGIATFDALKLESPEISIKGEGWIDFHQNKINMDLNLITRAKKNITKIPLVGYIISGKEKHPSITVKVSGNLSDPQVKHSIFQEVATQPFSMVYRTLALPGYLVSHMFSGKKDDKSNDGTSLPEETTQKESSD